MKEKRYPIRLMFGISNNEARGFSIVYEKDNDAVGLINVWYGEDESDNFRKIKFTNSNKSEVVFGEKKRGIAFKENFRAVKEIIISRNATTQ